MLVSPLVLGLNTTFLTEKELIILKRINPLGVIIFKRNIKSKKQITNLIKFIKENIRKDILIFIDQEGGPVQRLTLPYWKNYPSFKYLGDIYEKSQIDARNLTYCVGRLIASDLKEIGINVNCSPCLDVRKAHTSPFLRERIFSENPVAVSSLGQKMATGLMDGECIPVIKHIPGHGRATDDSHYFLPTIEDNLDTLLQDDFKPFKELNYLPISMTAHINYRSLDNKPATFSRVIIDIIRESIGFSGLIITDDINMKALDGDIKYKTFEALNAGCDLILNCSGDNELILNFIDEIPKIDSKIINRISPLKKTKKLIKPLNEIKDIYNFLTKKYKTKELGV
tara:strand:+ start:3774 stop:4793 length:1020 start_codon:yes stop_codon:yes gene_type:complete